MNLIYKYVAGVLILAMSQTACAQYKRPPLMIKVPNFYDHKIKMKELTLAADSYLESSKSEHFFNSDLPSKGFFPIHFIAFNYGESTYDLAEAKFYLLRDDGALIEPMDPKLVAKKVLKHTPFRMLGWGFAGLIVLSVPLSLIAGADSFRANQDIKRSVKDNTLRIFQVGPKEAVGGFYFFQIGKGIRGKREAREHQYSLMIEDLKENETGNVYEFRIGLAS